MDKNSMRLNRIRISINLPLLKPNNLAKNRSKNTLLHTYKTLKSLIAEYILVGQV